MSATFFTGLLTGLALIAAVGAQAAFVLRQGIRREHIGAVVSLCIGADVFLISCGIGGIGSLIAASDTALKILTYGGALYLLAYAYQSFRAAATASNTGISTTEPGDTATSLPAVIAATAAITFLNPHVYLDTVLMLGNIAHQYPTPDRWVFGGGTIVASILWFVSLGYGATLLAPYLARTSVWRGIDAAVGCIMTGIAAMLLINA